MTTSQHQPVSLDVRTRSRVLDISFADGSSFSLPFEYLRVYSPSAEVRGHGQGQETLQTGKRLVGITGVEPVGHYAIRPLFDDGHDSGIYTWDYLYKLGQEQQSLWAAYLQKLQEAGYAGDSGRDAAMLPKGGSCATRH